VVFAETGGSADIEDLFNRRAGLKLSANNLSLAVDATKGRNDEQQNAICSGRCLETVPSARSSGDKPMIFTIGTHFCDFKASGFLVLP
jgi:hypothetical protein